MIDFDALVLGPAMDVFARPVRITPVKSAPGRAAFDARGIWSSKPQDVMLEDGGVLSTNVLTLDIRASEFAYVPAQGDVIFIPAEGSQPELGSFTVDDNDSDGQAGYVLTLKARK